MKQPTREELAVYLKLSLHTWVEERLLEIARERFNDEYIGVCGMQDIEIYDDGIVQGAAWYICGDESPIAGWVKASLDDLLSAEEAHKAWLIQQEEERKDRARRNAEFKAQQKKEREEREHREYIRLKAKFE